MLERYGRVNKHNGWVPRDFWPEDWERQAIVEFHRHNPLEGYRRLTFMMLDADLVAVSPASVWRVLSRAGLLGKWNGQPSRKGTGFQQPPEPHQHWRIDVSCINLATHVRTAPCCPQSNGKIERWHKSLKSECLRPGTPLTPEDARRQLSRSPQNHIGSVDPHALKIPARRAEYSLTENARTPVQAEPEQLLSSHGVGLGQRIS